MINAPTVGSGHRLHTNDTTACITTGLNLSRASVDIQRRLKGNDICDDCAQPLPCRWCSMAREFNLDD